MSRCNQVSESDSRHIPSMLNPIFSHKVVRVLTLNAILKTGKAMVLTRLNPARERNWTFSKLRMISAAGVPPPVFRL